MRPRTALLGSAIALTAALSAGPAGAQTCDPFPLWSNRNPVTRATSDAQFGLGLSFVVTGPTLRAVWNEAGTVPTPHAAGDTRWAWTTGGATIQNLPNPVVLSSDNKEYIFLGADDGRLYKIDAASGLAVASFDTRRPTCAADAVPATPAVQLYAYSNAAFQNDMNSSKGHDDDLVIVITKNGCGDHVSNRVFGFYASDLTLKWVFNNPATQPMDGANEGCAVNYATNQIFCGTGQTLPTQPTLWGLNSITGTTAWATNAGAILNRPTLNSLGNLFVVSNGSLLQKRSLATGGVIWSQPFSSPIIRSPAFGSGGTFQDKIFVLDSNGGLHAIQDAGGAATPYWGPVFAGAGLMYVTAPAVGPQHMYLGRNDGRVQQMSAATGAGGPVAVANSAAPPWDPTVDFSGPSATSVDRLILPQADGSITRYCIPWAGPTAAPAPLRESIGFPLTTRPNPTSGAVSLEFELPFRGRVEIDVSDVTGHRIRSLLRADRPAGHHAARWDALDDGGRPVRAGIYFLRLRALGADGTVHERSRKIEVLR